MRKVSMGRDGPAMGHPSLSGVMRLSTLEHSSAYKIRAEQTKEGIHTQLQLGMKFQSPSGVRRVSMMSDPEQGKECIHEVKWPPNTRCQGLSRGRKAYMQG